MGASRLAEAQGRCRRARSRRALPQQSGTIGCSLAKGRHYAAAAGFLVDGRPGPPFGFAARNAARLVALFDVFGPALLLVGVARLVAARHRVTPRFRSPPEFNAWCQFPFRNCRGCGTGRGLPPLAEQDACTKVRPSRTAKPQVSSAATRWKEPPSIAPTASARARSSGS